MSAITEFNVSTLQNSEHWTLHNKCITTSTRQSPWWSNAHQVERQTLHTYYDLNAFLRSEDDDSDDDDTNVSKTSGLIWFKSTDLNRWFKSI